MASCRGTHVATAPILELANARSPSRGTYGYGNPSTAQTCREVVDRMPQRPLLCVAISQALKTKLIDSTTLKSFPLCVCVCFLSRVFSLSLPLRSKEANRGAELMPMAAQVCCDSSAARVGGGGPEAEARVLGVLAMSRAIGDGYLKPYVSSVTVTDETDADECLILASDGLWDVVTNEDACEVARVCLRRGRDRWCAEAAALLTKLALARRSSDNVSVVVVDLRPKKQLS
jgi:hypothetical protein